MQPEWTLQDEIQALDEGWGVFRVDSTGQLVIQASDEAGIFVTDEMAQRFVTAAASHDHPLAQKAIAIVRGSQPPFPSFHAVLERVLEGWGLPGPESQYVVALIAALNSHGYRIDSHFVGRTCEYTVRGLKVCSRPATQMTDTPHFTGAVCEHHGTQMEELGNHVATCGNCGCQVVFDDN